MQSYEICHKKLGDNPSKQYLIYICGDFKKI